MTPDTTLDEFKSWVGYAKDHNYWLVIVYHEAVSDSALRCTTRKPTPTLASADYDSTVSRFKSQLDYIDSADSVRTW